MSHQGWLTLTLLTAVTLTSGCGLSGTDNHDVADADEQLLNELLGHADTSAPSNTQTVSATADAPSAAPTAQSGQGTSLELRLNRGDRFPLIKTIEQTLIQRSDQFPATAHTQLDLTMAISVRDASPEAILMHVDYSRVRYSHDINGHRIVFDSDTHQGSVPEDVVPYAGMVGNGFSFWLGRNNQIKELVDYREFLQQCVRNVPVERRQTLLSEISTRFGDDGVANFVDDTIGLLPYNSSVDPQSATQVLPGDVWKRERRLMQPIPIYMTSTYRLVNITDTTAEIDITGRIASGETFVDSNNTTGAAVRILGGQSLGSCLVDRATGLPLELKRTRFLNMQVKTEDGTVVSQDKQIVTTIRSFPESRSPASRGPVVRSTGQGSGAVQQASGIQTDQNAIPIPTTPDSSGATRAVY
jgi:hypothetical protein